jgi:DNA polymerase-3 subunit alpha
MTDFARYAFNKSHAAAYAVVAFRTAFLKRHYPCEFMAALLTSVLDWTDKIAEYIVECQSMGIRVLPPDVNESDDGFTVSGEDIRFGLVAVKNVGRGFIRELMEERREKGKFTGFEDFCGRMSGKDLNKRLLESLIRSGAFDGFGHRRSQLLAVSEQMLEELGRTRRANLEGQTDLFGSLSAATPAESLKVRMPDIPEFDLKERLSMEKETIGLYLSGHPVGDYQAAVKSFGA